MQAKRLINIVKLRRAAVDDAQRAVAECVAIESRAEAQYHDWESKIWRETEAASALDATDMGVGSFAKWLPEARHQLATARAQYDRTIAETSGARAHLAATRAALSAVEDLYGQAQQVERANANAQMQRELDQLIHIHPQKPSPC